MTAPEDVAETTDPAGQSQEYDPGLVAAVKACQLTVCTEVVPEALQLRLAHAVEVPAGQWRRTAGADDPEVLRLEAPYRRFAPEQPESKKKATGSRRRRNKQRPQEE